MADVKLVNENGKIVGKDPNTGETVPIEFGESVFDAAKVDSAPTADTDVVRKLEADSKADLTAPDGVLQSSQVPDLSITETFTVVDQAARLSLNVQEGDVAIQTDNDTTYIFTGGDPSVNSNWSKIQLDVLEAIDGSDITPSSVTTPSVETGRIDNNHLYAGGYDGSDADARLDAALADAPNTATIHLEQATYSDDRNLSEKRVLKAPNVGFDSIEAANIAAGTTWTLSGLYTSVHGVRSDGTINLTNLGNTIEYCRADGEISVSGDRCIITKIHRGNITLETGSSGCVVDACAGVSVTDNGSGNVVGDIS